MNAASFDERKAKEPPAEARFKEDITPLLRSRVNYIILMGVFLVPFFGIIDYYLYPTFFASFITYRLVAAAGCLVLYVFNRTRDIGRNAFYLGAAAFYLVGLSLVVMVVDLGGYSTPYYAGLNLVFIGFCAVLPVESGRLLLHCAVLYFCYVCTVLLINWPENIMLFLANNMFVVSTLVIVVTAAHVDYRLRWREYLLRVDLERLQGELKHYSEHLEDMVEEKQKELVKKIEELDERKRILVETQRAAIHALAKLAESRDKDTGEHLERIRSLCRVIAEQLRTYEEYRDIIDDEFVENLADSCALHDLGKVAIPDAVLLKPDRLTDGEYEVIKQHAVIGGEALRDIDRMLGDESFISMGCDIAYYHHEKYDGSGYPTGLKGEEIPLAARIVAVADVYDALTSRRCYRDPSDHEEAVQLIESGRNYHFDPTVVQAFLEAIGSPSDRGAEKSEKDVPDKT